MKPWVQTPVQEKEKDGVGGLVEWLKGEALNSNPSITKTSK
jgi:hypothetical protein